MKLPFCKFILSLAIISTFFNFAFAQTQRDEGIQLFKQGKYEDTATSLKKAVEQNDKDLDSSNYLGWTLENQSKTAEAAKIYKKCVETLVTLIEERLREKLGSVNQANKKKTVKDFMRKRLTFEFGGGMACANGFERTNPKKATSEDWQDKILSIIYFGQNPEIQADSAINKNSTTNVKIIKKTFPSFTDLARANQTYGTIRLSVLFLANGRVGLIVPLNFLTDGLTESAINAAKNIRFEPAVTDGKTISTLKQIEYSFATY